MTCSAQGASSGIRPQNDVNFLLVFAFGYFYIMINLTGGTK